MLCKYCNKECKNGNALRNHERLCKANPNRQESPMVKMLQIKHNCKFCKKEYNVSNITRHENSCKLNPETFKLCPVCDELKRFEGVTCSYACSNSKFRTGENHGNWKESAYRTTCFNTHEKKCCVCDESLIVAVHHYDGNRKNNKIDNLIPMCPTHHQYWHSNYRYLIEDKVKEFIDKFNQRVG